MLGLENPERARPPRRRDGRSARRLERLSLPGVAAVVALLLHGCEGAPFTAATPPVVIPGCVPDARFAGQKIQHVIVIMQENRSFDHYFGTFPGADGIPMDASGSPTVCVPDPMSEIPGGCQRPYHDTSDVNYGGPHTNPDFLACYDGGKLDGFVASAENGVAEGEGCTTGTQTACKGGTIDVMGYHTDAEIPNYWAYARSFVLNDHLFEPLPSWSFPAHIEMVSGWSAVCTADDPLACTTEVESPGTSGTPGPGNHYPWTDLTYLLRQHDVCWRYYLGEGSDPHCGSSNGQCQPIPLDPTVPSIWNPLPEFDDVVDGQQADHVQSVDQFYKSVAEHTLPTVSWIIPSATVSEHPASTVSAGQAYVTALINTIMQSPYWRTTAIFLSWDDWGGFYDHEPPMQIDAQGLGFRVPGLIISPWVRKAGLIDGQLLSHDSYRTFIEDTFLGGARLDPTTDGRPDSRPFVRDSYTVFGDLRNDFDFSREPLPPLVLPLYASPL